MVNRTQWLVLGFFFLVCISLAAILLFAPSIYDSTLRVSAGRGSLIAPGFFLAISILLAVLATGVVRRWRWTFWLIAAAFVAGVLRVPASVLQLAGTLPATGPAWYAVFQAGLGTIQFLIGLAMLAGYRRAGAWGAF